MTLTLRSPAFEDGGDIPVRHTCDGENVPPPLEWSGAPEGTEEFALIVHDPDARGFVHWVVTGIPGSSDRLPTGVLSGMREGRNDFGRPGYGGPCPPSGRHRYVFTLYALSASLKVSDEASAEEVRNDAASTLLGEARLTGTYARR